MIPSRWNLSRIFRTTLPASVSYAPATNSSLLSPPFAEAGTAKYRSPSFSSSGKLQDIAKSFLSCHRPGSTRTENPDPKRISPRRNTGSLFSNPVWVFGPSFLCFRVNQTDFLCSVVWFLSGPILLSWVGLTRLRGRPLTRSSSSVSSPPNGAWGQPCQV